MIHYMTGQDVIYHKTGCGLTVSDNIPDFEFAYWRDRHTVDCPDCIKKIQRIETMSAGVNERKSLERRVTDLENIVENEKPVIILPIQR